MTRFRRNGLSPRLFAIAGIDTAIIVESSPSMKKAQPTTSGITTRMRGARFGWKKAASLTIRTVALGGLIVGNGRGQCGRMGEETIGNLVDEALIERWALAYLGRFASSAENLRRVLLRRARRRLGEDRETL